MQAALTMPRLSTCQSLDSQCPTRLTSPRNNILISIKILKSRWWATRTAKWCVRTAIFPTRARTVPVLRRLHYNLQRGEKEEAQSVSLQCWEKSCHLKKSSTVTPTSVTTSQSALSKIDTYLLRFCTSVSITAEIERFATACCSTTSKKGKCKCFASTLSNAEKAPASLSSSNAWGPT